MLEQFSGLHVSKSTCNPPFLARQSAFPASPLAKLEQFVQLFLYGALFDFGPMTQYEVLGIFGSSPFHSVPPGSSILHAKAEFITKSNTKKYIVLMLVFLKKAVLFVKNYDNANEK